MGGSTQPANTSSQDSPLIPTGDDQSAGTPNRKTRMGGLSANQPSENSETQEGAVQPTLDPGNTVPTVNGATRMSRMASPEQTTADVKVVSPTTTASIAIRKIKEKNWGRRIIFLAALTVLAVVSVFVARWLMTTQPVSQFVVDFPGYVEPAEGAPIGLPAWLNWQHFLNIFFMVLIVRTGLQVRLEKKVPAYWTARPHSFFSPKNSTPKKVSLTQWVHQSLDIFWVANGLIFVVLLFVTGQWLRIVPTSWDVFPNALSTLLQYASLNWPLENSWVHYNSLQILTYFTTVFIAAPLAIITGIRFSTWWPDQNEKLSKLYPIEWARAIHFPVMVYFLVFTGIHVFLVFFTGALRNLNHMFTSRDVVDWWGLIIFVISLVVIAAGWWLTKPLIMRSIASKFGTVSK